MRIDVPDYLELVEATGNLVFVDTEDTGTKGDYNSVMVVSLLPYNGKVKTLTVAKPGDDRKIVSDFKNEIEQFMCVCTYYGKGFDWKMLNTRLTRWGSMPIAPMHHIDLYFTLKHNLLTARRSQAHLLRFFDCKQQKMDMNPEEWNAIIADPVKNMPKMVQRCESDVKGLQDLYNKTKHLIKDIKAA